MNNFIECKEHYTEWLKQLQTTTADDNRSVRSSASSVRSARSMLQSARAKRLVAEHRLKTLREKQNLEHKQKELENQRELLEQESELEEAKIEESVFTDVLIETSGNALATEQTHIMSGCDANIPTSGGATESNENILDGENSTSGSGVDPIVMATVQGNSSRVNGKTGIPIQSGSSHSNGSEFERLASILQEGFNLPKPELLTFNGSVIDYTKFIKNFETYVESKVSDNRLKLSYLIQYCSGEAKSCIEDCVLLSSDDGYKRAKEILQSRYGDALSMLALDMQRCQMTLSQIGFVSDIDNSENLRRLVRRLPMHLRTKWADIAHSIYESGREPSFSDLTRFIDERSRVASSVYGIDIVKENVQYKGTKQPHILPGNVVKDRVTTLSTCTENEKPKFERKCSGCFGSCIDIASCHKFINMSLLDRKKHVLRYKLCFNCLKRNHMSSKCRKQKLCTVSGCTKKHHTLLQIWVPVSNETPVTQQSVNCAATNGSFLKTCLGIIPVSVKGGDGNFCHTYALLDDGADKTLCDERLIRKLNVPSKPVTFKISTVNSADSTTQGQEVDLTVSPIPGDDEVKLNNVWTMKQLPISKRSAATASDIRHIPYLSDIKIPVVNINEVMLLIGTDTPEAHIPLEVRT
ncbi:uncharacterized protein LOC128549256 [Mercenaria mercenaria]|uniref:uncharacterized protein LOC128549256 n=1 Tax=Mercenaria mercenaria TaxID=6596 RepID=UPI00234FA31A|nr:uncharacterized protein LOC128549256 [Mercenaria mercenaria]